MQIDLAHDWPVLIWIPREMLRSVPRSEPEMIWKIAGRAGDTRAKESVLLNLLCCDRLLRCSIEQYLNRACVRAKNANLQIITNAVRTQHAERIRMNSADEAAHLVTRQSGNLEGFHAVLLHLSSGKTDCFALQRCNARRRATRQRSAITTERRITLPWLKSLKLLN